MFYVLVLCIQTQLYASVLLQPNLPTQSILHKDPNVAVLKGEAASSGGSKYPGPLVECHYWDHRLMMLVSLKNQISSAIVRNILRNLEQSYASSFYSLQKDITKVFF